MGELDSLEMINHRFQCNCGGSVPSCPSGKGCSTTCGLSLAECYTGYQQEQLQQADADPKLEFERRVELACAAEVDSDQIEHQQQLEFGLGGLNLDLYTAANLPSKLRGNCFKLTKKNMLELYADEWDDQEKRNDFKEHDARFVVLSSKADAALAAFMHYRFVIEEGAAVLYIYELQVSPNFQRKGLGAALVQISERLGRLHQMGGVVLTCFRHNTNAMAFYSALGYSP